jgi:hypothetical protein
VPVTAIGRFARTDCFDQTLLPFRLRVAVASAAASDAGADPRSATMGVIGKSVVATTGSLPTGATARPREVVRTPGGRGHRFAIDQHLRCHCIGYFGTGISAEQLCLLRRLSLARLGGRGRQHECGRSTELPWLRTTSAIP